MAPLHMPTFMRQHTEDFVIVLRERDEFVRQPRLPSALSARRSIGSTITLVPTLTRE